MSNENTFLTPDNRTTVNAITPASGGTTDSAIDDALETIGDYKFNPPTTDRDNQTALALMMYMPQNEAPLPSLRTEPWKPPTGKAPDPISISKARRILAVAYSNIPCEMRGTGDHGYAWMIEEPNEWTKREGVQDKIVPPTKPEEPDDEEFDMKQHYTYLKRMKAYKLYTHLVQEGREKIVEWFGKSMFVDLYERGMLPVTVTPKALLEHLSKTYAKSGEKRHAMRNVVKEFHSAYDHKQPVEAYFMKLQEAQANAALLDMPFTNEQMINQALEQFEKYLGKDAYKAERKWNDEQEQTWSNFKAFWKSEIHQWERINKSQRSANMIETKEFEALSAQVEAMRVDMSVLQDENRSYQQHNQALLAKQAQFQDALRAESQRRNDMDDNSTISGVTDYMAAYERGMRAGLSANASQPGSSNTQTNTTTSSMDTQQRLQIAKQRKPDTYKYLNGGRGRQFTRYCWHCGCNCTHSTRGCYELTEEQKRCYQEATFNNTMGGNLKFIERRGKYQKDFGFDSL